MLICRFCDNFNVIIDFEFLSSYKQRELFYGMLCFLFSKSILRIDLSVCICSGNQRSVIVGMEIWLKIQKLALIISLKEKFFLCFTPLGIVEGFVRHERALEFFRCSYELLVTLLCAVLHKVCIIFVVDILINFFLEEGGLA